MRPEVESFCRKFSQHLDREMELIKEMQALNLTKIEGDCIMSMIAQHPHTTINWPSQESVAQAQRKLVEYRG